MPPLARHWRRALWIALFAVLLNALAPAITSVKAAWLVASVAHDEAARASLRDVTSSASAHAHAHAASPVTPQIHDERPRATHHTGASPALAPAPAVANHPHADCAHAPLDDCPFCHVHAGSFGLPAPEPMPRTADATPDAAPVAWSPAPHRFDPWRHARPRGPPVSA